MHIVPYKECSADAKRWDDFIPLTCNGNFLHSRRFLSYHGDRFKDCSVFLEDGKGKLLGLFPAAALPDDEKTACSHPGATYGGIVHKGDRKAQLAMEEMVLGLVKHYRREGFNRLLYKEVPHIYTRIPAKGDAFALFRAGFRMEQFWLVSAISPNHCSMSTDCRRNLNKSVRLGVTMRFSSDPDEQYRFWKILAENLHRRYRIKPTHSWQEIRRLFELFPDNISFALAEVQGSMEGGIVWFRFPTVLHTQYMVATEGGRKSSVLIYLIHQAYKEAEKNRMWISFGNSNTADGSLNQSLQEFKSGLGGGGVAQNVYCLDI